MSNRPFKDYSEKYIELAKQTLAPETIKTRARRYNRMNNDVVALRAEGKITTMSPKEFTPEDVTAILLNHKAKVGASDMAHEIVCLRKLCEFAGNSAVSIALAKTPGLRPKVAQKRKDPMAEEDYKRILSRANDIKDTADFETLRAYALVLLMLRTGCRNKEIRFADRDALDTNAWTLDIVHVKGEASYGQPRVVPIHPDVRPVVLRYIRALEKLVVDNDLKSPALFPAPNTSKDYYLCSNTIANIARRVWADLEIKSDLRQLRRTFGQMYLDKDLDIESVSVLMGHSSTKVTELFYGRRRNERAMASATKTWEQAEEQHA